MKPIIAGVLAVAVGVVACLNFERAFVPWIRQVARSEEHSEFQVRITKVVVSGFTGVGVTLLGSGTADLLLDRAAARSIGVVGLVVALGVLATVVVRRLCASARGR